MSLKARLRIALVAMVLLLTTGISLLHINRQLADLFAATEDRAQDNADLVKDFVIQRINEKATLESPPPETLEESAKLWRIVIEKDTMLDQMLSKALGESGLASEIFITDPQNIILKASNTAHVGGKAQTLEDYNEWQKQPLLERLISLYKGGIHDYAIRIPLGSESRELFRIQVVISASLMRAAVQPVFESLVWITGVGLGVSLIFAAVFANFLVRPLARMSTMIDRITQGSKTETLVGRESVPAEFKELESKLDLLGAQVRGTQQEMSSLLEQMDLAVFIFDPAFKCIFANGAADGFLGRDKDTIEGNTLASLFPADTKLGAALQASATLNKPLHDYEVAEPRRLQVSMETSARGLMITMRDAESRSAVATQLDMSKRLSAINHLTGNVAHEIKNPMNAIAIHLEVLKAKFQMAGEDLPDEVVVIGKEIARLDRVVKTFLDFNRPLKVNVAELDLVRLTAEAKNLLAPQASACGVDIVFTNHPPEVPVMADRDLLQQAILNVASNGIEAMGQGGALELKIVPVGKLVILEISDQGQGIPLDQRDKIFNLYFTTKEKGNGIGLAVSAKVLQLMGGGIEFDSTTGQGTTFRLKMPAALPVDATFAGVA